MTSKAYVLIKTNARKTSEVHEVLAKATMVKEVDVITGPYDLIAILEGETPNAILDFLMREMRYIDGVVDTITCFVVTMGGSRT